MKILLVDNEVLGHHQIYLKNIILDDYEYVLALPERIKELDKYRQYIVNINIKTIRGYIYWHKRINDIAKSENVDIVHILNADLMIRYFGFLVNRRRSWKLICTFHHFTYSFMRSIARRMLFDKIDVGIVHTGYLYSVLENVGIKNCKHIEYPVFENFDGFSRSSAREFFGIPNNNVKVLGAIGGTRQIKGLNTLLTALDKTDMDFYLLIAGKEEYFTRSFIEEAIVNYEDKVYIKLKYLNDEELKMALFASDILVLPYSRDFDGASGPLSEGVYLKRCIIGPSHGSLGKIIRDNHIGYCFETGSDVSLCSTIEQALKAEFTYDNLAESYRKSLKVDTFRFRYRECYERGTQKNDN